MAVLHRHLMAACLWTLTGLSSSAAANETGRYLTVYAGQYTDHRLTEVFTDHPIPFEHSYALVAAFARALSNPPPGRQWEIEAQLAKHVGRQTHWEFNALLVHRWNRFPWNRWLRTSMAIGDGLSYATVTPPLELESPTNEGASRFLNYLLLEISVSPPSAGRWSLVGRIHHRSGVYGLFGDVDGGSNIVSLGVKYRY